MSPRRSPRAARALLSAILPLAAAACEGGLSLGDPLPKGLAGDAVAAAAWADRVHSVVLVGAPPWVSVVLVSAPPLPRPARPRLDGPYLEARFGETR